MSGWMKFLIRAVVGAGLAVLMSRFFFHRLSIFTVLIAIFLVGMAYVGVCAKEGPVKARRKRRAQGIKSFGSKKRNARFWYAPRSAFLFVAQGLDGIQAGRFAGRVSPKKIPTAAEKENDMNRAL